ncbi:MAG: hypothetical protein M3081_23065 [Gemmatimonadota bacterium]|nr:hypothetical protein [Gemmatimonadota bacterium]
MTRLLPFRWISAAHLAIPGVLLVVPAPSARAPVPPSLFGAMVWRNVGPFRGGRISAVSGAIGRPGVFYAGTPAGGVWKTTSAGHTWYPVFDSVKNVSSIGAVEVAPSDPNVIYAGTGDLITGGGINEGDGIYKSSDAGRTWRHLGLEATKQIPSLLVDPRDPALVMIAAQGNIHQKSDVRGVYRSSDGGATWTKTLYVDDETGIQKLAWAYDVPAVVFATTVRHYTPPGPPQRRPQTDSARTGTAVYKSTDEGVTWHEIAGGGLPRLAGRTSIAVAAGTNAQRVYLIGNFGLYRSDDGGTTWRQMDAADKRIANGQGGYNCGVYVDPKNPDIVYTISTSSYKSVDGGNSFTGFKGAPGGDDPQQLWIDPTDGQRMLLGLDQGASVTLDGGAAWSSWYNQSTEQVYHLSTDNSFPYWIYATQQDAGAVATRSRGNLGAITPLDWKPVPGWEWGTIVPDPLDANIVYASGNGILKITYPDERWISVSPAADPGAKLRVTSSQPLVWSPFNQHELLAGFQYLMSTTDGGAHWTKLSDDVTIPKGTPMPTAAPTAAPVASAAGAPTPPRPGTTGAIETISASSVAPGTIWVGTNNGLIKLTRDHGKTWEDVSIPGLAVPTLSLVSTVEASYHDAATAYVAIDAHRSGDNTPHFYRTKDYGKTWTPIVSGLPDEQPNGAFARVIRADSKRAGLLFAGTESAMYVSFDDGDHWQSLQLNLPTTSYRDITIHGSDLVVGTYGRGIWILDDFSVLRQATPATAEEPVHLFKPADVTRIRRNVNADTPYPPEIPHALNPPDGVIIDYALASKPSSDITLDVIDAAGNGVRHLSSAPIAPVAEAAQPPEPNFWIATPAPMPKNAGGNRTNWDLRYDTPPAFTHTFEINANPGLTPASPEGALALPGVYTLKLTVDGKFYTQTVTVRADPRAHTSPAALAAQHALLMRLDRGLRASWDAYRQVADLRGAIGKATSADTSTVVVAAVRDLGNRLDAVAGNPDGGTRRGSGGATTPPDFVAINRDLVNQLNAQDNGDLAPTPAMLAAVAKTCNDLKTAQTSWSAIADKNLGDLSTMLTQRGLPLIAKPTLSATKLGC